MGYDIRPIEELETFDFSLCRGFSNADTVRKSIDGEFFIVEGESFNAYTLEGMLVIVEQDNWTTPQEEV